jgi:hypothetical protein
MLPEFSERWDNFALTKKSLKLDEFGMRGVARAESHLQSAKHHGILPLLTLNQLRQDAESVRDRFYLQGRSLSLITEQILR